MSAPIIYNLFPRLVGHMGRWSAHAGRAREMGFNWLFLNPIQYPGFSGSLYAVKDLYRLTRSSSRRARATRWASSSAPSTRSTTRGCR